MAIHIANDLKQYENLTQVLWYCIANGTCKEAFWGVETVQCIDMKFYLN